MTLEDTKSPVTKEVFPDEFVRQLPTNPLEALNAVCQQFDLALSATLLMNAMGPTAKHQMLTDAYAFLNVFVSQHRDDLAGIRLDLPKLDAHADKDESIIIDAFKKVYDQLEPVLRTQAVTENFEASKTKYASMIGSTQVYRFTAGDLEQIRKHIDELRRAIEFTSILEDDSALRVEKHLGVLSTELGPAMERMDLILGSLAEVGLLVGRFGEASVPMLEPLDRIAVMASNAQRKAYGLPILDDGRSMLRLMDLCKED